ncbi:probable salivary secreted peptide isoform X1 [Ceratitis capitata]|uniref:probable salivary secreted peptide isoform X1 n=1 Tax=Ceratitis capitata TaxID=7213 RepID=UPI000A10DDC8|nr:probable salivary secreted peptide isoform X1 [Ceratitis capitata]
MKSLLIYALFICIFTTYAYAGTDYLWGEITDKDYLISKETVSKAFVVGLSVSKKYVFKQKVKDNLNAFTITAIKVTDKKKSGATVTLVSGGLGSKGVTLLFKSQRGKSIKDVVEIYGR